MCLAWPIPSAKTLAQNPAGSVMPPLSAAHLDVLAVWVLLATIVSEVLEPSDLTHATIAITAVARATD
jgi:hypothetical protein